MRNLNKYMQICKAELDAIGVPYGRILKAEVNTRAKKRWGQCVSVPGGYTINISSLLLDDSISSEKGLKNTIIHELIHSAPGCMNHGPQWKSWADKVNKAYGYGISRTGSLSDAGISREDYEAAVPTKYAVKCQCCGAVIRRQRMSDLIKYPEFYRCGKCGGKLERVK